MEGVSITYLVDYIHVSNAYNQSILDYDHVLLLVTLSGSGSEQFTGFLVQARSVADGSPVGVFTDNGVDQALSSCSPIEVYIESLLLLLKINVCFSPHNI